MKILVLGDPHFGGGYSLGRVDQHLHLNSRLLDFSNTFDYVIDYLTNNNINNFFITGDIFEHRRPHASEINIFSQKVERLSSLKINTYIIVGNHDLIKEQKITTIDFLNLLKLPYVKVFSEIGSVQLDGLDVILIPFKSKEMLCCSTNEDAVEKISLLINYEREKLNGNKLIAIGHLMLQGTLIGDVVLEGSPGEVVLPQNMFNDFEAVIMGHVHPHMVIRKHPFMTYLGSMECKDFNEAKYKKYFLTIDVNKEIDYMFGELPVRKLYEISTDQSSAEDGEDATEGVLNYLNNLVEINDLKDSIVRVEVVVNEKSLYNLNKDKIRNHLKQFHKIHYCVGIYPQVVTKRQLRKSTITERNDPITSFLEYIELEGDLDIRNKMKLIGSKIISEKDKI